ncbi:hypothetical protein [Acinetobacter sp. BSP-28]|uniref:hypothetical protein n=1 Tax=Acinetobacter sp. BSP-28 TaxID=3344661 RepID=UPI00376FDC98
MNQKKLYWGMGITAVWLAVIIVFWIFGGLTSPSSLNELGDFLAGIFAPVAFLWLILGYVQQGKQLEQNSRAIKLQAEALNLQIEEFRKIVALQEKQNLDKKMSVKPKFLFNEGVCIKEYEENEDEDIFNLSLQLLNHGTGEAFDITVNNKSDYSYSLFEVSKLGIDSSILVSFSLYISSFDQYFEGLLYRKLIEIEFKDKFGNQFKEIFTLYIGRKENDMGTAFVSVLEGIDNTYDLITSENKDH